MSATAARAYSICMDAPKFLSGQLLLAMPGIGDPRFDKAVIAMCVHDEDGALGIGLGRLIPRLGFHDLLRQLEIDPGVAPNAGIHHGGPVEPQRGFILHSPDWGGSESVHVGDRWVLSATLDVLKAIAEGKGPSRWVAALGYAGWGAGQLEAELHENAWLVGDPDEAIVFDRALDTKWARAMAQLGIDPAFMSGTAGRA